MMPRNHQWAIRFSHSRNNTCTTKREDLIESIGVVLVKYPPKVKLELLTILECQSGVKLCVPWFARFLGFYSGRGLTSFSWARSFFLIAAFMTVFGGTLSLLESFWVALNVKRKIFPYICKRGDQAKLHQGHQLCLIPSAFLLSATHS